MPGFAEALLHIANLSDGQAKHEALVQRAELLATALGQTAEALDVVEQLLTSHPGDPGLLTIGSIPRRRRLQ